MNSIALNINQKAYSGFESVLIYKSMLSVSGAFAVSLNNFYIGGSPSDGIKLGHECKLEIEGQPVITGWVDRMPIRYGYDFNTLEIGGRDKTCDLVDCSHDTVPNEWKKQTVENIVKNLCSPFGISVAVDKSATAEANIKVETFKANEGQYVYEIITELCRDNSIIPLCYGDGKLTLTKATTDKYTSDGLMTGVNIDGAYLDQGDANRYSSYKVKGQGIGDDTKTLGDFVSCYGTFEDNIIDRYRPLVLFSDLATTLGGCQRKAKWEARVHAGISRLLEYQVPSWCQENGKIWEINNLVKVRDDILGFDSTFLIMDIKYIYNKEKGQIAKLGLVDKDTFNLSDNKIIIKTGFDK